MQCLRLRLVAARARALQLQAEDVYRVGLPYLAQLLQLLRRDGLLAVEDGVDTLRGVEQQRDHYRRVEVVVHRLGAFLREHGGGIGGRSPCRCLQFLQALVSLLQAGETFLRRFQGCRREVHRRAIVRHQDKETYRHRRERLREQRVLAAEELLQRDEVVVALAHLLAGDGNHVVVHPIVHGVVPQRGARLCYLCLVVGEHQVHAAAVDVELLAEVFRPHRRALHVPAGKPFRPRARPVHDMLRRRFLPQREVVTMLLLRLPVQLARLGLDILKIAPR